MPPKKKKTPKPDLKIEVSPEATKPIPVDVEIKHDLPADVDSVDQEAILFDKFLLPPIKVDDKTKLTDWQEQVDQGYLKVKQRRLALDIANKKIKEYEKYLDKEQVKIWNDMNTPLFDCIE